VRNPGTERGQDGRAHDHAQGVGRDQLAALGNADLQTFSHVLQQAHDGEFRCSNTKSARGQGNDRPNNMGAVTGLSDGSD
jgi:hypothetical protein